MLLELSLTHPCRNLVRHHKDIARIYLVTIVGSSVVGSAHAGYQFSQTRYFKRNPRARDLFTESVIGGAKGVMEGALFPFAIFFASAGCVAGGAAYLKQRIEDE